MSSTSNLSIATLTLTGLLTGQKLGLTDGLATLVLDVGNFSYMYSDVAANITSRSSFSHNGLSVAYSDNYFTVTATSANIHGDLKICDKKTTGASATITSLGAATFKSLSVNGTVDFGRLTITNTDDTINPFVVKNSLNATIFM